MSEEQYNEIAGWDEEMDTTVLARHAAKQEAGKQERVDVPHGTYEVAIDNIVLQKNKYGVKQMCVYMDIVAGEYQYQTIAYYQNLDGNTPRLSGFFIAKANKFLRSLKTNVEVPSFTTWSNFAATIEAVKKDINKNGWEYQLNYGQDKNPKYNTYTIEERFEPQTAAPAATSAPTQRHFEQNEEEDDIPF